MPETLNAPEEDPIKNHPFVKFVQEKAQTGSLREQVGNFIVENGPEGLPRNNDVCARVIKKAMQVYAEINQETQ
jgi:hypothetical protein